MADEELKPEVAVDDAQDKAIEIDLDKPEGKPGDKPASSEQKYVTVDEIEKIRKQLNGLSYLGRQFNEFSKKIDALQVQTPAQRVQVGDKDPYDELVEKDWKQAVRQLAREEAKAEREAMVRESYAQQQAQEKLSIFEKSKQTVRERFPEVDDPGSEIAKKYMNILNRNQDYLRNDRGPILAMRDMEDELKSEGRLDEFTKKAVEKEVNRVVRTGVTSVPRGNNGSTSPNKVSITREQKEFCDHNNIRYEDYALMLKKQTSSGRQGVEA